jgi:hypothetical protein
MEVIKSYTGIWTSPVFGTFTNTVKETISIIHCDELYIVMRVSEFVNTDYRIPIETKNTKDYATALGWYEEWNKQLMCNMTTT